MLMPMVRQAASVWTLAMVLIAFGLTTAALGQASKASGIVTAGKTKVTIASAMAVGYKAPNGQLISVLLSDKPANAKEFATDTRIGAGQSYVAGIFEGAWKSQHADKRLSGFMFTIDSKGTLLTEEFLVGGQNNTFMIGSDEYVLNLKSTSPRLVGSIKTKKPSIDIGGGRTAGLDATFDVAVGAPGK
jgi:hypothetical protein